MTAIDWKKRLPVLLLAAFAAVMLWPLIFRGETWLYRDFGRFYAPVKQAYLDRLLRGEFCIWLPEMNCGTPVHGGLVHAFLYPGNILLFAGESLGWGLFFAVHVLLAGLGARALARRLGATPEGALAAGIAFAGSGYFVSQMNHVPYATVAAWAPIILATGLSAAEGKRRTVPLLALAFTMAALGGEPFSLILTVVLLGILVLAGLGGRRIPGLLRIGVAGIVALLLASPALLPAWDVLAESARAEGFENTRDGYGSVHPMRLSTLFSPEGMGLYQHRYTLEHTVFGQPIELEVHILLGLWFGAVALVATAFAPIRKSRAALVLLVTAFGFGLLALGDHLGIAPFLTKTIPGLAVFRYADKYWLVVTLAAAPLVGLTLPLVRRRAGLILAATGAGLAAVATLAFEGHLSGWTGVVPFALVGLAMLAPAAWRTRILTGIMAAELLFFGLRHHSTVDPVRLDPRRSEIGRVLNALDRERIYVDIKDDPTLEDPDVTLLTETTLRNFESVRGVGVGFSYSMGYDPTDPLARIAKLFRIPDEVDSRQRTETFHRLLRLTATTHSITNFDLQDEGPLRKILDGPGGLRCYRYVDSMPRARLYGRATWVKDVDEGEQLVEAEDFDPFRTLVLEGEGKPFDVGTVKGEVEFLEDADRTVTLRVRADRPCWLFLADTYAQGWRATVNGKPAEIVPAMAAFRAVRIQHGESKIRFRYEPGWLRIAPFTFGAGIAILLGLVWWSRRRRRPAGETGGQGT